jgi:hypothetical protein
VALLRVQTFASQGLLIENTLLSMGHVTAGELVDVYPEAQNSVHCATSLAADVATQLVVTYPVALLRVQTLAWQPDTTYAPPAVLHAAAVGLPMYPLAHDTLVTLNPLIVNVVSVTLSKEYPVVVGRTHVALHME